MTEVLTRGLNDREENPKNRGGIAVPEHRSAPDDSSAMLAAQSRTLRNSIISLSVFFGLVVALLFGVPGLRSAGDHISDARLSWVAAAVALEVLSLSLIHI